MIENSSLFTELLEVFIDIVFILAINGIYFESGWETTNMTTNDIINLGFQRSGGLNTQYVNGLIKVEVAEDLVTHVFVTDIKVTSINKIEELQYLCKKLGAVA